MICPESRNQVMIESFRTFLSSVLIMRFRDVQNAVFHYQGKKMDMSFTQTTSDWAYLTIFSSFREEDRQVEDGFSGTKRVGHFKKTNALEREFLNLYTSWKAFNILFLKNHLTCCSQLLFYSVVYNILPNSLALWAVFNFSPHFSCALSLPLSMEI